MTWSASLPRATQARLEVQVVGPRQPMPPHWPNWVCVGVAACEVVEEGGGVEDVVGREEKMVGGEEKMVG